MLSLHLDSVLLRVVLALLVELQLLLTPSVYLLGDVLVEQELGLWSRLVLVLPWRLDRLPILLRGLLDTGLLLLGAVHWALRLPLELLLVDEVGVIDFISEAG